MAVGKCWESVGEIFKVVCKSPVLGYETFCQISNVLSKQNSPYRVSLYSFAYFTETFIFILN